MSADVVEFPVPPVVKQTTVALSIVDAFARFADEIDGWWPLATHSIFGPDAATIVIEQRLGGRLLERDRNGNEHLWGTVTRWQPPHALAFTWHVGRSPETAQTVELTFAAKARDRTHVTLVHRGWEALGADAEAIRNVYDGGWEVVFCQAFACVEGEHR